MEALEAGVHDGRVRRVRPMAGRHHGLTVTFERPMDLGNGSFDLYVPLARIADFMKALGIASIDQMVGCGVSFLSQDSFGPVTLEGDGGEYDR